MLIFQNNQVLPQGILESLDKMIMGSLKAEIHFEKKVLEKLNRDDGDINYLTYNLQKKKTYAPPARIWGNS